MVCNQGGFEGSQKPNLMKINEFFCHCLPGNQRNRLQVPIQAMEDFFANFSQIRNRDNARVCSCKHYLVCVVVQLAYLAGMLIRVAETQLLARCT
jgi:hypothetical protein